MGTRANIKIEPMKVLWGDDIAQEQEITLPADTSGSMNNKYFRFYKPDGTAHYVWFNINSAGVDPAPANGGTGHEVTGATNATATALASAAAAVMGAVSGFDATSSGAVITLTNTDTGYATPVTNGNVGTGFGVEVTTWGESEEEVGFCDGAIEYSINPENADVTSHQTGSTKLTGIQTGINPEVKLTLKETSLAQLRKLFMVPGTGYPSVDDSSSEVFGLGSGRQFQQTFDRARRLILHPVRLDDADHSEDRMFWKAYAKPDTFSHSGEEVFMMPITFEVYPDFNKPDEINLMCFGDYTQFES